MRKCSWLRYVLHYGGFLRDILEGRMLGKSLRGLKRLNMVNDVKVKESCGQTRWEAANGAYGLISECRWKPASNSRRQ